MDSGFGDACEHIPSTLMKSIFIAQIITSYQRRGMWVQLLPFLSYLYESPVYKES